MGLRGLSEDEVRSLKRRILELLTEGLSVKDICERVGIDVTNLKTMRRRDQMFEHHLIRAGLKVNAGAGRRS